jgi:hypothetical protein
MMKNKTLCDCEGKTVLLFDVAVEECQEMELYEQRKQ